MANIQNLTYGSGSSDGVNIGQSTTEKIAFYGVTPIVQRASSKQATLSCTITTSATCVGFTTTAQMQTLLDQVTECRDSLVAYGLWKGGA